MKCLIVYYVNGHWIGEEVSWKRSGSGSYREISRHRDSPIEGADRSVRGRESLRDRVARQDPGRNTDGRRAELLRGPRKTIRRSTVLSQPLLPPDDLAAVAPGILEERGLQLVVVDQGLGLEDDSEALELGLLAGTSSTQSARWHIQR